MDIYFLLRQKCAEAFKEFYSVQPDMGEFQIEQTLSDFKGDLTVVVFPLLRYSKKAPDETARQIGAFIIANMPEIECFEVVKGFLNFTIKDEFFLSFLNALEEKKSLFPSKQTGDETVSSRYLIEYSSPNTNKPLHLGHIRNNLIGHAVSEILRARGHDVIKVNLINDRGIHISKSMLAWMKYGEGKSPQSESCKGDHFVGDFYVLFDKKLQEELKQIRNDGGDEEDAQKRSKLMKEAYDILRNWELKDEKILSIWEKMNNWVYEGFNKTYQRMGISFDKVYYESDTYLLGKDIVNEGIDRGVFYSRDDGSVWVDLSSEGLDEKLLLRADGTSVYITQDLGTAELKHQDFAADHSVYVVGNEQEYHFQVLKLILKKLGKPYADNLVHLSYGMVDLPEGKMKSREGTVVDADDLMDEMKQSALNYISESGKALEIEEQEQLHIAEMVGLAALKYHILKVDIKKNITFNPKESIDFQGHTGPFIQYTHARIKSVLRKATLNGISAAALPSELKLNADEKDVLRLLYHYNIILQKAEKLFDPSVVAHYIYQLSKAYNKFYHDNPILKEADEGKRSLRLILSSEVARMIKAMSEILGIDVPEKM